MLTLSSPQQTRWAVALTSLPPDPAQNMQIVTMKMQEKRAHFSFCVPESLVYLNFLSFKIMKASLLCYLLHLLII